MSTYADIRNKLAMRAALDLLQPRSRIFDPYEKENDPVNISIHIRECANGVLVSTGGSGLHTSDGEMYFSSWEVALSEIPGIGAEALERANAQQEKLRAVWDKAVETSNLTDEASEAVEPVSGYTVGEDFTRDAMAPVTPPHSYDLD